MPEGIRIKGVRIGLVSCASELSGSDLGMEGSAIPAGIGTFCHEFGHFLGLTDLYDTDYGSGGMSSCLWGRLSLMDEGNYNNSGRTPPYFCAIDREQAGILTYEDAAAGTSVSLPPIHECGWAVRINTSTPGEYYLLEHRTESGWDAYIQQETEAMRLPYLFLGLMLVIVALVFVFTKFPKIADEQDDKAHGEKQKLIDFGALRHHNLRWGVIAQFFYNGGQTAINSLFLVYCCVYAGLDEATATTFFGIYMLAFLAGRWVGTALMVKFKPQHMLLFYSLMLMALCVVISVFGGQVGLYAMIAVSFFMSIVYPTQFSLALQGLGGQTKSGSAFLVMAIVGNACLPQLTAYVMHINEHMYQVAYLVPMACFAFCAYYGWKGYKKDKTHKARNWETI